MKKQRGVSIDEQIEKLVDWRKKYPELIIIPKVKNEILKKYATTDEELEKLIEEYKVMQNYYNYVRTRMSKGKLTPEQIKKCKEGNIGGVFGYPAYTEELAKKYGIQEKDVNYILNKYGTLDKLYEMYDSGAIEGQMDLEIARRIIRDTIDIDGKANSGYDDLWRELGIQREGGIFYSSEGMNDVISQLAVEKDIEIFKKKYGLVGNELPQTLKELGKKYNMSRENIRRKVNKILTRLRYKNRYKYISLFQYTFEDDQGLITETERKEIARIKKDIRLQNGDESKNLQRLAAIEKKIEEKKKKVIEDEVNEERQRLKAKIEEGNYEIEELLRYSSEDLSKLDLEPNLYEKISSEIEEYKKTDSYLQRGIEELRLSLRGYNILKRNGIDTYHDLVQKSLEEIKGFRGMNPKVCQSIIDKIEENGLSLRTEELEEERIESKEQPAESDIVPDDKEQPTDNDTQSNDQEDPGSNEENRELKRKITELQNTVAELKEEIIELKSEKGKDD